VPTHPLPVPRHFFLCSRAVLESFYPLAFPCFLSAPPLLFFFFPSRQGWRLTLLETLTPLYSSGEWLFTISGLGHPSRIGGGGMLRFFSPPPPLRTLFSCIFPLVAQFLHIVGKQPSLPPPPISAPHKRRFFSLEFPKVNSEPPLPLLGFFFSAFQLALSM